MRSARVTRSIVIAAAAFVGLAQGCSALPDTSEHEEAKDLTA
jgi:hypothetical protein